MTKDRLGEFKKKRLYGSFRGSLRRAVKPMRDADEAATAPILQLAKDIQDNLDTMQRLVADLHRLYSDIVTSPFAAPTALEKADQLNDDIRRDARTIKSKLSKLDPASPKPPAGNTLLLPGDAQQTPVVTLEDEVSVCRHKSGAAARLCKTHHVLLSTRLSAVMEELNAAEVAFRDDSRKRLQRQMSIAGARVTAAELEDKVDDNLQGNFAVFTQEIVTDFDAARMRKEELKASMERDKCIKSLEHSLKEMHVIFQDVAFLVGRQGEQVDSIQNHVQRTACYVEAGKDDLAKANLEKKRNGKLKVVLVGGIVVILLVIFVIIIVLTQVI